MKTLGRTKFDLVAHTYIILDVVLKEVLSNIQQKCKYFTLEPRQQLDENLHCTKLDLICRDKYKTFDHNFQHSGK